MHFTRRPGTLLVWSAALAKGCWSVGRRPRCATPRRFLSIPSALQTLFQASDFSDQLNYWHAGYSAVMITDTAFYRNRNYHTADDTEEKLDYKRMAMVIEGVYAAVADLARQ